ncbi:MAG: polysaccharide deacetylase family protein [Sandaracinaceae bacterium]|nr:polysaccharide deacetylase family protein [Sandaracinaceae bacterium]
MSTRTASIALTVLLLAAALCPRATGHAQAPMFNLLTATEAVAAIQPDAATAEPADLDDGEAPGEGQARDPLASDMADGLWTRGFIQHRIVHFTFDDGPRPSTTRPILDTLDQYGIKATFFVVGRQLAGRHHAEERALVREMAARGHTIGSHTWDHSNLTQLSDEQIQMQIDLSEDAFMQTFGERPWLFRPPYGARDRRVDHILAENHYTEVLWNVSGWDTLTRDPDEMLTQFQAQLDRQERHPRGPGGIILVHDTHEHTVEALPMMIEALRGRNCELLDQPGEELWDIVDDPRIFYSARGNRDPRMAPSVQLDEETIAARQAIVRAQAETYCR